MWIWAKLFLTLWSWLIFSYLTVKALLISSRGNRPAKRGGIEIEHYGFLIMICKPCQTTLMHCKRWRETLWLYLLASSQFCTYEAVRGRGLTPLPLSQEPNYLLETGEIETEAFTHTPIINTQKIDLMWGRIK